MRPSLFSLACLAACSDSPTTQLVDAPMIPPDAPYEAVCLIKGIYGDLGALTGNTTLGPTNLSVTLDAGPPRDSLSVRLVMGKGVFAGGLMNGMYTLAGADIGDFNSCGLCISIVADIVAMSGPSKFYFATSGMVTLTSTNPPAGSLTNVMFEETDSTGQPVTGGCTASITSIMFSRMP